MKDARAARFRLLAFALIWPVCPGGIAGLASFHPGYLGHALAVGFIVFACSSVFLLLLFEGICRLRGTSLIRGLQKFGPPLPPALEELVPKVVWLLRNREQAVLDRALSSPGMAEVVTGRLGPAVMLALASSLVQEAVEKGSYERVPGLATEIGAMIPTVAHDEAGLLDLVRRLRPSEPELTSDDVGPGRIFYAACVAAAAANSLGLNHPAITTRWNNLQSALTALAR